MRTLMSMSACSSMNTWQTPSRFDNGHLGSRATRSIRLLAAARHDQYVLLLIGEQGGRRRRGPPWR
jgi:hypothetical protein